MFAMVLRVWWRHNQFGRKGQDMVLAALDNAAGASGGGYEAAARPPVGPQVSSSWKSKEGWV